MNNPYKAQAFIETLEEELEKYEDETKYLFMDVLEILSLNHMLSIEAEKEEDGAKNKEDLKKSILIG